MFKRSHASKKVCAAVLSSLFLSACAPQQFESLELAGNIDGGKLANDEISSNFFKVSDSQSTFEQLSLDENRTTTTFQVRLNDGTYLNNLTASDIHIIENGVSIPNFNLTSNAQNIVQTVDIVFAVDITGSMTPTIESAKTRLINFVNNTRLAGYHTRMCLVTFGDFTVQKCNKFYDNNPQDPSTINQVNELVSEITKLRALKGAEDPGGSDFNENPMRAVIDSANAPWGESSQRFMILITDDGFLYSPGNQGAVGALAPLYSDVVNAINQSKMKVFAATPSQAGYNSNFSGLPGIVQASDGEFFLFSNLINGTITLDTILNRIISRVRTTYVAEYVVDEVPGLNPAAPLIEREIQIVLRSGLTGTIVSKSSQSNLPTGREEYKKNWQLTDKAILPDSLKVKVAGVVVPQGLVSLVNGWIKFVTAPPKGVKIEVTFQYASLKDSVQVNLIPLTANEDIGNISVIINGIKATGNHVSFERSQEGVWNVRLGDSVFAENDPFQIRKNGGALVKVLRVQK